jgi:nucleoside-triphosphatase THEP1
MIYILTGPIDSGKTSQLKNFITKAQQHDSSIAQVGGFLSLKVYENDQHIGYNIYDFTTSQQFPFLRTHTSDQRPATSDMRHETCDVIGKYKLNPQTLSYAHNLINKAPQYDIFIIDELGPLELQGKGFWPALEKVINCDTDFLFVIREKLVEKFLLRFNKTENQVLHYKNDKEKLQQIICM